MPNYIGSSINDSITLVGAAASAITNGAGKGVKFDSSGNIVLCNTAGENVLGVLVMQTPSAVAAGDGVSVQIKDIGMAIAGAAIVAGVEVAVDATGKFVTAVGTTKDFAIGIALTSASASGDLFEMQITKSGYMPNYASTGINDSISITGVAASTITAGAGKAVKFDSAGKIVLCGVAGEVALGVLVSQTPASVAAGGSVIVQIKDIGKGVAGAEIAAGAAVAVDTAGKFVTATAATYLTETVAEATTTTVATKNFVVGIALTSAGAIGDLFDLQITKSGYML